MWLFRDLLTLKLCQGKLCFAGLVRHPWWSACALAAKTHSERGGLAEWKQLHCAWFKSRLPHLFLMLEQLPDEISVCVSRPTARSDCLPPRKSYQWPSIEQIYTQLSQIYFCLFVVLNETAAPEEKDVRIPICDNFRKLATIQCDRLDFDVDGKVASIDSINWFTLQSHWWSIVSATVMWLLSHVYKNKYWIL